MTKIISLIDGSAYARSVCEHAAWVATRIGASVEVLHMLGRRSTSSVPADYTGNLEADGRDTLLAELAALDEQKAKLAQQRGRIILDQAKSCLTATGVSDVVLKLRNGDLLEALEEFEADAELVVIGKRGEAADFARLHLGSNLERVVRTSQRPVLVASREFSPIESFLVAFDGGSSAGRAVDHIARSALFAGLECRLLHVGTETADMRRRLDEAAAKLKGAGLAARVQIVAGEPATIIPQIVESDGIGLVTMGAYGHSRIRNMIVGSTTVEVVRSCKVPILMFR
ncbi:universal stress protein [Ancylobacter sp. TS-1]|uniref:universal stress protein n=1 Tax=Ancylobacter sp. TS-1 TaxID=1850374 RepID=UPI001265BE1B|nr:universal stress protein [Ancylobacter sp. TS-1]QFR34686.1 universal stress protein [Ancylobacter sp. TS-1]